jgi:dolichol kinase
MALSFLRESIRKGVHFVSLSIPIIYFFVSRELALFILSPIAAISLFLDLMRFNHWFGHGVQRKVIGPILRDHEDVHFTGGTYLLVTSVIAIAIFDKIVAVAAIAFIIFGDIAAALVGSRWGRIRFSRKSVEGSLACLGVCMVVALLIPGLPLKVGFIGAGVATVAEAASISIDDNLMVILSSGIVMQILLTTL